MDYYLILLSVALFLLIMIICGQIIISRHQIRNIILNIPKGIKKMFSFVKEIILFRKYIPFNKIRKNIKNIDIKIKNIKNNIIILSEHIILLDEISDEDLYKIQKNIFEHFVLYYNKYCSVYLRWKFLNLSI